MAGLCLVYVAIAQKMNPQGFYVSNFNIYLFFLLWKGVIRFNWQYTGYFRKSIENRIKKMFIWVQKISNLYIVLKKLMENA